MKRPVTPTVLAGILICVMLCFIYLPVVVLVLFSFQSGELPVPPLEGLSFRWYVVAISSPRLANSLTNSFLVGSLSSAAATTMGFLAAYGLFRHQPRGANAIRMLLVSPISVSYLIIGVGLMIVFNLAGIGRSLIAVGIGHAVINLPLCFAIIYSQLGGHLRNIDNAARDLGAGDFSTMTRVIAPIMLPSVLAAFFLSFTLSWDEFIIALLLSRFDVTLPVMIFDLMRAGLTPEVNATGTIILFISICAAVIAAYLTILRPVRKT
jgi:spermidine/putrescine transport system permease protein